MYPSDYGYATGGGSTKDKVACAAKELYNWNASDYADCKNNDWLFNSALQWTMAQFSISTNRVMYVSTSGRMDANTYVYDGTYMAKPVVYLKPNVKIYGGNGTKTNPYKLGL